MPGLPHRGAVGRSTRVAAESSSRSRLTRGCFDEEGVDTGRLA